MEYKEYKEYIIKNYEGKRIEEKVLRNACDKEYNVYCKLIKKLIDDEIIRPVKRSGPNGLKPTLYKRYQISKIDNNLQEFTDEIKRLHPIFNIEGYLSNSSKYELERVVILALDKFVRLNSSLLDQPASINERSFQIFGKEKFIRFDSVCKAVFNFNSNIEKYLNMYHTPEPFFEHMIDSEITGSHFNILIIENKDTWYTLKKLMGKGFNTMGGVTFNSLIFGEGKKITRKRNSLTEIACTYYGDSFPMEFYYFGDLDMEGIEIFENVVRINPNLKINLYYNAYLEMLKEAKTRKMPDCSEYQQSTEGKEFFGYFTEEQVLFIKILLDRGEYIPQEILSYGYLKEMIEKSN